jgi:hypothetical protein
MLYTCVRLCHAIEVVRKCHWRIVEALTYMKPAPPVTRMFLASGSGSNWVLPLRTGACFQSSVVRYDLGFNIVEFLLSTTCD